MLKYYINIERKGGKKETVAEAETKGEAEARVVQYHSTYSAREVSRVWWSFWPIREKT